jgi:N-acetylneuraminate lyase
MVELTPGTAVGNCFTTQLKEKMEPSRYAGLIAATLTPMKPDGSIAYDNIGPQIDRLIARGVAGLYVCGSTGEGVSLTTSERKAVTKESLMAASGRVPVLVQVGHNSLFEAAELAAHAASSGAAGISATCPSYFKIGSPTVLADSMAVVAAGAPDLPFYYYHIPSLTGNRISMTEFLQLGSQRMSNLVGLKFSSPELHEYQQCVEFQGGRFEIMWGVDEMLIAALTVGARAAVGSTYNVASPLYLRLIDAVSRGDVASARKFQSQAIDFISIVLAYPFQSAMKHIMHWQGDPPSYCRLPQRELTPEEANALHERLQSIGFFDWCN